MELKNKDYFVKGSRWYWYAIFFVLLNIVMPVITEVVFIIEELDSSLFMILLIIPLVILSILFIKKTIKREEGFSVMLLTVISLLYLIYYILFMTGVIELQDYYKFNDFEALLIIFPFGLGPFLLFVNFIISYKCHKKGAILANEKNGKLMLLGILSILVSLFFPLFILLLFSFNFFASTLKMSGGNNGKGKDRKKLYCVKCGNEINSDSLYCDKCGMKIDRSSISKR